MLDEVEWQAYLALERAGPRRTMGKEPGPSPWGTGEVECAGEQTSGGPPVRFLQHLLVFRRSSRVLWNALDVSDILQVLRTSLSRPASRSPFRPYPTSGGCDELGMVIAARNVIGLQERAYWASTSTDGKTLQQAAPFSEQFVRFEQMAYPFVGLSTDRPPAVTLLVLADWRRLSQRYEHCILASALWDCGALMQTLSLAAAAVGIHACICACIQPRLIGSWLNLDCREIGHIGTIALGGHQEPTSK